jgi:two-component system, LytTR family, sensor kinase
MPVSRIFNKSFLRNYIIFYIVVAFSYFTLITTGYAVEFLPAFTDVLISGVLLFGMLLGLWFVVRYARSDSISAPSSIRNSILAGGIIVSAWVFLSNLLLQNLFREDPLYLSFLSQSLSVRFISGLFIAGVVYLSYYLTLYRQSAVEAVMRENELKELVQKTELQALKNQLNPHFIYNSLNSVSALTIYDPAKAREMVGRLAGFLRVSIRQDSLEKVPLAEEISNIELYLSIEKVRFEDKLSWHFNIPESHLNFMLPALILQPLFENAVKHGVRQCAEKKPVIMTSQISSHFLVITVENYYSPEFIKFKGEGVGLENIRNRLRIIYGRNDLLEITSSTDSFIVKVQFPF